MVDIAKNFFVGTLAGCTGVLCVQPMDMVKVRTQLSSEARVSTFIGNVVRQIYSENGIRGFYKGLDSALLR